MQEDIRRIAESLGNFYCSNEEGVFIGESNPTLFNPYENSADAFMVLEALVKYRCNEMNVRTWLEQKYYQGEDEWKVSSSVKFTAMENDLKHAICNAYLSLIGDKE